MTDEVMNVTANSELEKYLKKRKEVQTEAEMRKVMGRIYGYIAEQSKLIHAFRYSIPPIIGEDGTKTLQPDTMLQLALIYSDTDVAYLPVYTSIEESKNRNNLDSFPELADLPIEGYYDIVFGETSDLQGIVINPYTDNFMLNRAKLENMMKIKNKSIAESHLILDSDLKISKVATLSKTGMKEASNFGRKRQEINALWIFEKNYLDANDNKEHVAILFVVQDSFSEKGERTRLYEELKSAVILAGVSNEIHVESIEEQREDFVRKNGCVPFYQKVNVFDEVKESEEKEIKENIQNNNVQAETSINDDNTQIKEVGWNAIESEFLKFYPGQTNPKHYGALIKWKFGGPDPLDGISVYDAGEYWHFVTFGLSELYEKESENKEISGFGLEFTYKLKKGCYEDEEAEIKSTCGLLQQIARIIVVDKEMIKSFEYLYTGQTDGVDAAGESKITGFITVLDTTVGSVNTPNGHVDFVELIGVTDKELIAIMNKETSVRELYEKLGTDVTDYRREDV